MEAADDSEQHSLLIDEEVATVESGAELAELIRNVAKSEEIIYGRNAAVEHKEEAIK